MSSSISSDPDWVLLGLSYDGAHFHGWAAQPGQRTVEGVLREAVSRLTGRQHHVYGTSRTDAGVHAEEQVVAVDARGNIPARGWVLGLNRHLPDDVAVRWARAIPVGYRPRFASAGKIYRYDLLAAPVRDPLERGRRWRIDGRFDRSALATEAAAAVGTFDFRAFRSSTDARQDTVRTVRSIEVSETTSGKLSLRIEGNAFLHNMVRILVGTSVDVARGRLSPGTIRRALESGDRRHAGQTAPAHGLTLERVLWLPPNDGDVSEAWPPS